MLDIQVVIAIIGAITFFTGLFGGIKIECVEIPTPSGATRYAAMVTGVILIGIAIWPFLRDEILTTNSNVDTTVSTEVGQLEQKTKIAPIVQPSGTLTLAVTPNLGTLN